MMNRIPEQRRSANRAETAPHLFRGAVPFDVFFAGDRQCRARHIDRGFKVAALFAARNAVAGIRLSMLAFNGYLDGSA
jgi:hypothetical protein